MHRAHAQVQALDKHCFLISGTCTRLSMLLRDGEEMRDPFGERRGKFQWKALGEKLAMLRENNPQWFVEVNELKNYSH